MIEYEIGMQGEGVIDEIGDIVFGDVEFGEYVKCLIFEF